MDISGVDKAIVVAGNMAELGRSLGISRQAVRRWKANKVVPENWVDSVERLTGVPASELNPNSKTEDTAA